MKWLMFTLLVCGCVQTEMPSRTVEYTDPVELYLCPQEGCGRQLVRLIENASTIHCALHDLDLEFLQEAFMKASDDSDVRILLDNNYKDGNYHDYIRFDDSRQISHNKFCVIDMRTVWSGSFNPTFNGDNRNHNNVLVIHSSRIAEYFSDEFHVMWQGIFGNRKNYTGGLSAVVNDDQIDIYFCPQDFCAQRVMELLLSAKEEILFMTFSFTHQGISDTLIDAHRNGIEVRGVMERSQNSRYSVFDKLNASGIDIRWDDSPAKVHHKVFIVDGQLVLTGSMNPSENGDLRNDENIIIIDNIQIAKKYAEEFKNLFLGKIGSSEIV